MSSGIGEFWDMLKSLQYSEYGAKLSSGPNAESLFEKVGVRLDPYGEGVDGRAELGQGATPTVIVIFGYSFECRLVLLYKSRW